METHNENKFSMVDHKNRMANGCLCCGNRLLKIQKTIISPYLAEKAWGGISQPALLVKCTDCGSRFFDRGLSKEEASRYYDGYQNEDYYLQRNHYEPFYTKRRWKAERTWLRSDARRGDLAAVLKKAGIENQFGKILDYGGGNGHLIKNFKSTKKAVFDLGQEHAIDGIEAIKEIGNNWDLIIAAHVFEHVNDPMFLMSELVRACVNGGYIYIEVPNELWIDLSGAPMRDEILKFITPRPTLRMLGDIYSTIIRVAFGFLPPWGFVPMREHLNYFTLEALQKMAAQLPVKISLMGENSFGHYCIIIKKQINLT